MNRSTVAKAIVSEVLATKYDPAYWGTPTVRNVADTAAHGYIYTTAASIASEDYPSPSGSGWTVDMAHDINVYLTANYPDYWVGPYSGWLLAVYYEPRTTPPAGGSGGPSFTVKTTGRNMVSDIVMAGYDAGMSKVLALGASLMILGSVACGMDTTTTIPDTTTLTIECIGGPEDYGTIHINGTPQAKTVNVAWANPTHPTTAPLTLSCGVDIVAPNNPIIISVQ
jgi:hypothetical protein